MNAVRHEIILLGNDAHGSGTVGLDRRAEIALDEFALQMKGRRVDDFDIAGWVQPIDDAGHDNDRHHDDEHRRHDLEPKVLGASDDLLRNDTVWRRSMQLI